MSKWGQHTILGVEDTLRTLGKHEITAMQTALNNIATQLTTLIGDPKNEAVQACIARRYEIITRLTGGKIEPGKLEYFRKLGEFYAADKEDVSPDGLPSRHMAVFIKEATDYYLKNKQD